MNTEQIGLIGDGSSDRLAVIYSLGLVDWINGLSKGDAR